MKRTWTLIAAAWLVAVIGCEKEEAPPRPDANRLYEEFFLAFTRSFEIDATSGNFVAHHGGDVLGTLVLHAKTGVPRADPEWDERSWDAFKGSLPSIRRETYDDFWARNAEPRALTLDKAGSWQVRLLPREEFERIQAEGEKDPKAGFWGALHARFPNAQLGTISAPGLSRDGTQMLVYFQSGFAQLAASASYYLLEKEDGVWKVDEEWLLWVS